MFTLEFLAFTLLLLLDSIQGHLALGCQCICTLSLNLPESKQIKKTNSYDLSCDARLEICSGLVSHLIKSPHHCRQILFKSDNRQGESV